MIGRRIAWIAALPLTSFALLSSPAWAYTPDLDLVGLFPSRDADGALTLLHYVSGPDDTVRLVGPGCRPAPAQPVPDQALPMPVCVPDCVAAPGPSACAGVSLGRLNSRSAHVLERESTLSLWLSTNATQPSTLRGLGVDLIVRPADAGDARVVRFEFGPRQGSDLSTGPGSADGTDLPSITGVPRRILLGAHIDAGIPIALYDELELRVTDAFWTPDPREPMAGLFAHVGPTHPTHATYRAQYTGHSLPHALGEWPLGLYLDSILESPVVSLLPPNDTLLYSRLAENQPGAAPVELLWQGTLLDESTNVTEDAIASVFVRLHMGESAAGGTPNASVRLGVRMRLFVDDVPYEAWSPKTLVPVAATQDPEPTAIVFPFPLKGVSLPAGSILRLGLTVLTTGAPGDFDVLYGSVQHASGLFLPATIWRGGPVWPPVVPDPPVEPVSTAPSPEPARFRTLPEPIPMNLWPASPEEQQLMLQARARSEPVGRAQEAFEAGSSQTIAATQPVPAPLLGCSLAGLGLLGLLAGRSKTKRKKG